MFSEVCEKYVMIMKLEFVIAYNSYAKHYDVYKNKKNKTNCKHSIDITFVNSANEIYALENSDSNIDSVYSIL